MRVPVPSDTSSRRCLSFALLAVPLAVSTAIVNCGGDSQSGSRPSGGATESDATTPLDEAGSQETCRAASVKRTPSVIQLIADESGSVLQDDRMALEANAFKEVIADYAARYDFQVSLGLAKVGQAIPFFLAPRVVDPGHAGALLDAAMLSQKGGGSDVLPVLRKVYGELGSPDASPSFPQGSEKSVVLLFDGINAGNDAAAPLVLASAAFATGTKTHVIYIPFDEDAVSLKFAEDLAKAGGTARPGCTSSPDGGYCAHLLSLEQQLSQGAMASTLTSVVHQAACRFTLEAVAGGETLTVRLGPRLQGKAKGGGLADAGVPTADGGADASVAEPGEGTVLSPGDVVGGFTELGDGAYLLGTAACRAAATYTLTAETCTAK